MDTITYNSILVAFILDASIIIYLYIQHTKDKKNTYKE